MSPHSAKSSFRYILYILLWASFLFLQVLLFAPTDEKQDSANIGGSGSTRRGQPPRSLEVDSSQLQSSFSRKRPITPRPPGDALFNNIDVYYKDASPPTSDSHCIGRDFTKDPTLQTNFSWMFRSCQFQNLCLDTATQEFVLIDNDNNNPPQPQDDGLALGSINPRWSGRGFNKGFHKVKWFPRTVPPNTIQKGYYQLPDNVVMVPFHSMAAHNVGHLLWDDFYPIFTLLQLFGFTSSTTNTEQQEEYQHLLLRWTLPDGKLYATCEMQKKKIQMCQDNFQRFLPLLGVDPNTFSTVKKGELKPHPSLQQPLKSTYVCSKHSVAGLGMLSDHGLRDHGWLLWDKSLVPHNMGRGTIFRDFRNFMVHNMGFPLPSQTSTTRKKITFSTHSSKGFERSLGFENQTAAIQRALLAESSHPPVIQSITMRDLSLPEQIQVALESAIYVTVSGGGAVTATFLPPGSTLIVYYLEDGGFDYWNTSYTYTPARLDWDLLSNAGHLRVHWLPMKTMNSREDLEVLEQLVLHELDIMGLLDPDDMA